MRPDVRSLAVLMVGAALLAPPLFEPFTVRDWRDADLAAVARNFHREGMNPLQPRIDWRGDGPGTVSMEFPFLPWSMAASYSVLGEAPISGVWLSFVLALATLASFLALARQRLAPLGVGVAGLWLAINPIFLTTTTALRPDTVMLLGYVAAVHWFFRWIQRGERRDYWLALAALAISILAKLTALHLGLLFAALVLRARGRAALRAPELWLFAAAALAPAAAWYLHAQSIWAAHGHSLGLSNQDHFVGLEHFFGFPGLRGIQRAEVRYVFSGAGLALVALAAVTGRWRRWLELEIPWAAALAVFFVLTSHTTGAYWARHYHLPAVPLAALLIGDAVQTLLRAPAVRSRTRLPLAAAGALLGVVAFVLMAQTTARQQRSDRHPLRADQACAEHLALHVPADTLLLESAKNCRDEYGLRVASNRPFFLYWMDRKGFQVCREDLSEARVEEIRRRGAGFLLTHARDLRAHPGLEDALRAAWPLAASCENELLFDLREPGP